MLVDLKPRLEQLQEHWQSLSPSLDLESKEATLDNLQAQMQVEGFWTDQEKAQKVSQEAAHLEKFVNNAQSLASRISNVGELLEIASENDFPEIEQEVTQIESLLSALELQVLLNGPYDAHDAIVSIHVGTGGQDAEEFTLWLQRMYLRYGEKQDFKVSVLEESTSDVGLKSCMLEIKGPFAYGYLKAEHGVQRLIRLSPFNAKNLRQTSFAKVEVIPLLEDNTNEIEIDPSDLRVDVFRSSGAGGQSVNTTDSAVRLTYLPLNIVVTCQNERSQMQNKENAMKVLKSKILQLKMQEQVDKVSEIKGASLKADFSNQIRTFTLQPYQLVKDHRTNYEEGNPEKVLDGHIEGFMEAYLKSN